MAVLVFKPNRGSVAVHTDMNRAVQFIAHTPSRVKQVIAIIDLLNATTVWEGVTNIDKIAHVFYKMKNEEGKK